MALYAASCAAEAQTTAPPRTIEQIIVSGSRIESLPSPAGVMSSDALDAARASSSDTTSLLRDVPGLYSRAAGGVSGLPVVHGLADDRLRTLVDGVDLVSSCANHMNAPLSYLPAPAVSAARVFAGITPVSFGGDSIGGTLVLETLAPSFAAPDAGVVFSGATGGFYRSNGDAHGGNVSAAVADAQFSLRYSGALAQADNYEAGGDFKPAGPAAMGRRHLDGDEVGSSYYETTNQALVLAWRRDNHLLDFTYRYQFIPEQGYANQRMDMTSNQSDLFKLRYQGAYGWGTLESRLYYEHTRHGMNFGDDKQFFYGDAPGMPMETDGRNVGWVIKADVVPTARDILRVGFELQRYRLDDYWPASGSDRGGLGMMAPDTFLNINDGRRDRYDTYVEWEAAWTARWSSQLGIRYGAVRMNSGDVHGYSNHDGMGMHNYRTEATAFNARDRKRSDDNVDLTALARFTPDAAQRYEFGYARKNRSPNLYERYSWSTSGMSMIMVNTAGDGNGYVGDIDLDTETAHTLSASADWHAPRADGWQVRVTPYFTYVEDYIDAERCQSVNMMSCGPGNRTASGQFVFLRYVNEDARLVGVDVSGSAPLIESARLGAVRLEALLAYVDGRNAETGDGLYNIMPLNARLRLVHRRGGWQGMLESELVDAKDDVSDVRNEIHTAGYALLHLRASFDWRQLRLDAGIENLLDKRYALPLGGAYVGQGMTMAGNGVAHGIAVPGMGRSVYTAVSLRF
ncbi:MAG: TonB-dependent receptor plug domain-containing protein [Proteobacteria bacterium]|nr:TonB-dependent receptor plug domain-containing protein [Pseudomonadota bacterium]